MARALENFTNVDTPSDEYPYGRVRDNNGSGNGTPVNEATKGDHWQFFARLMGLAGITPNNQPDNAVSGFQLIEALMLFMVNYLNFIWTSKSAAAANSWKSVAYGNGVYVAVSTTGTGNRVMTSHDGGNTWVSRTSAANNTWESVTFGDDTFVAVSSDGTDRVMTSSDGGITWVSRSASNNRSWRSVTYGGGLFVAVASDGVAAGQIMTSPDGTTWTDRTSSNNNGWVAVHYANGLYVTFGLDASSDEVMYSSDAVTWSTGTAPLKGLTSVAGIAYGRGVYVALSGSIAWSSADGQTWTARTSALTGATSVVFADGVFVAVAESGTDRVATSLDGITWTARTAAAANQWQGIAAGSTRLVAVANSGTNRVMVCP